jgi:hypothetical protein
MQSAPAFFHGRGKHAALRGWCDCQARNHSPPPNNHSHVEADFLPNAPDCFQPEAHAVFQRTAVFVFSLVCLGGEELADEITC